MIYTTIQDNLEINLPEVKTYLKVENCEEDDLIRTLIAGALEFTDNFLQNDFRTILSEIVGVGDDILDTFSLSKTDLENESLVLWKLIPGTLKKLPLYDPKKYGYLLEETYNYTLDESTGEITLTEVLDKGYILYAESYRLSSSATINIPEAIKIAVYQIIAYYYNNRVAGQLEYSIDGLGSCKYDTMPTSAINVLKRYRSYPGL